jgi:sarcosine oxidase
MRDVDFLVLGLGAVGSAVVYHLARMGRDVVGLEQFERGHALGSSHGRSRAFRTLYHDPLYTELAEAALPLWRELESSSGESLLHLCGNLTFARSGNTAFEGKVAAVKRSAVPFEMLSPQAVSERFPALRIPDETTACFTPRAGFLDPGRAVLAHLAVAEASGAEICTDVRVEAVDADRDKAEIRTTDGSFRARRLVITAGPWTGKLLQDLGLPLRVTRQQTFSFGAEPSDCLTPERLPVYADLDTVFYGFPLYAGSVKVADDSQGQIVSPDSIDRTLDPAKCDELAAWLARLMPAAGFTFLEGSTCMYTMTPEEDFLIGPHPVNPSVLVAAGFSGHGFKFSTLVGRILAEVAVDGQTAYPVSRFRLDRFGG